MSSVSHAITRLNAALSGRYAIERELGEGGMTVVFVRAGQGWEVAHDHTSTLPGAWRSRGCGARHRWVDTHKWDAIIEAQPSNAISKLGCTVYRQSTPAVSGVWRSTAVSSSAA